MKYRDIDKAIKVASKKVKIQCEKQLRDSLDYAVGGEACEAYRLGVEEAQGEIVGRLQALKRELSQSESSNP